MKLTRKKAISITIELWEELAERGCEKWKCVEFWKKYGEMANGCPLCEYNAYSKNSGCYQCPYYLRFGCCDGNDDAPYSKWGNADAPLTRKKYASQVLAQLRELE